jgi:hypothetical protein
VDRPKLSPEDIKKLQAAQRNNKMSEERPWRVAPL